MSEYILPGSPPISLSLRRSKQARRISLRVSRLDGRVTLTLPKGLRDAEALDFAREKESWLRRHLAERPLDVQVAIGTRLPILGVEREIISGQGRSVVLRPETLLVPGAPDRVGARLLGFVKQSARGHLSEAIDHYSDKLGRPFSRLTIRDTRSRWGSCSSQGALMFSWRLLLAPKEVLDYVAAHEVAHLQEMNHSDRFWALVDDLYGDPAEQRKWLRLHGETLHRYRFQD